MQLAIDGHIISNPKIIKILIDPNGERMEEPLRIILSGGPLYIAPDKTGTSMYIDKANDEAKVILGAKVPWTGLEVLSSELNKHRDEWTSFSVQRNNDQLFLILTNKNKTVADILPDNWQDLDIKSLLEKITI